MLRDRFVFIRIMAMFTSILPLAWGEGQTIFGHNEVEISRQKQGNEQWFSHLQSLSFGKKLGARFDRTERFGLIDRLISGQAQQKTDHGTIGASMGLSEHGDLLPKYHFGAEINFRLKSPLVYSTSVNHRHYRSANLQLLSVGIDYYPKVPFYLVLRGYLARTIFDQVSGDHYGTAVLAKGFMILPQDHLLFVFFASGREGILLSNPPQPNLISSRNIGGGAKIKLSNSFTLVPEISIQEYPSLDLKIVKYGVQVEVGW